MLPERLTAPVSAFVSTSFKEKPEKSELPDQRKSTTQFQQQRP
jgi:hypothetical protein